MLSDIEECSNDRISIGTYEVEIGYGLLQRPDIWSRLARNNRLIFIADAEVWHHHGEKILSALDRVHVDSHVVLRRCDESLKGWDALGVLVEDVLALHVERTETLIAVGGGVIGDVAGLAASIIKRGCPIVHVPTTLLAQVDSSIGGKTAINSMWQKNAIGTFHQPTSVLVDPEVLASLPDRQIRSGLAEMIKYGIVCDPKFFEWCESNARRVLARDEDALLTAIAACIRAKARLVTADERDLLGQRALLNFGHTFAHALEAATKFSGQLLHGEAVAIGMVLALRLSVELGLIGAPVAHRCERLLQSTGLPVDVRAVVPQVTAKTMIHHMRADKKMESGVLPLILIEALGSAFVSRSVSAAQLEEFLERQGCSRDDPRRE